MYDCKNVINRGAEIIERLRQKQIEKRQEQEEEVLRKIKRKMEKIRATQQKMLRPLEKPTHFDGKLQYFSIILMDVLVRNEFIGEIR